MSKEYRYFCGHSRKLLIISFIGISEIFVGIDDKKNEGQFVYASSGKDIVFSNWDTALLQPNNGHGGQDCVLVKKTSLWYDVYCTVKRKYACETSLIIE